MTWPATWRPLAHARCAWWRQRQKDQRSELSVLYLFCGHITVGLAQARPNKYILTRTCFTRRKFCYLNDQNDDKLKLTHAYNFTYSANSHNSKKEIMTVKKYISDTKSCLFTQSTLYFVTFVLRCLIFV